VYTSEDRTSATAQFSLPGTYLLRFTSSDSQLSTSDDITITVLPSSGVDLTASNLTLTNVSIDGQTLAFQADAHVNVSNAGQSNVASSFNIIFFEDRNANGHFDTNDNVLGTTALTSLAATTSTTVNAHLSGTLLFQSNLIYAFVDSDNTIVEDN